MRIMGSIRIILTARGDARVPAGQVMVGDVVLVETGSKIPAVTAPRGPLWPAVPPVAPCGPPGGGRPARD